MLCRFSLAQTDLSSGLQRIALNRLFALGETVLLTAFDAAVDPLTEIVAGHTKSVLARLAPSRKKDKVVVDLQKENLVGDGTRLIEQGVTDLGKEGETDMERLKQLPTLVRATENHEDRVVDVIPGEGSRKAEPEILPDIGWRPEEHWATQTEVLQLVEDEVPVLDGIDARALSYTVEERIAINASEVTEVQIEDRRFAEVSRLTEPVSS